MSKRATESTLFKVNNLLGISDSYQAPEKVMEILKDKERRKELFFKFLTVRVFDYKGDLIAQYEGKLDVQENDHKVLFDLDGKRYIYYNCLVEVVEK